jgi:hypothetical protein
MPAWDRRFSLPEDFEFSTGRSTRRTTCDRHQKRSSSGSLEEFVRGGSSCSTMEVAIAHIRSPSFVRSSIR